MLSVKIEQSGLGAIAVIEISRIKPRGPMPPGTGTGDYRIRAFSRGKDLTGELRMIEERTLEGFDRSRGPIELLHDAFDEFEEDPFG